MIRIVCVGNRLIPGDDLGPRVFDHLTRHPLPESVEVIDGGLQGLDLLRYFEGIDRVVIVDALRGFGPEKKVLVLDGMEAVRTMDVAYSHANGLAFLLKMLPHVLEHGLPEIVLVGGEGRVTASRVKTVAQTSLRVALEHTVRRRESVDGRHS